MGTVTVKRVQPGVGCWTILLDGVTVGGVRGATDLGYDWSASNGCHGITKQPTLQAAVDALVNHLNSHQAVA